MRLLGLCLLLASPALALEAEHSRALLVGDCSAALQGTAALPAETIALARCEVDLGRPDAALARLERISGTDLDGYASIVRAEAHQAAGDPARVAAALAGVVLTGDAGARAQLMRGRAQIESGDFIGGRDTLRPLMAGARAEPGAVASAHGADPAEVRWWLAEGAVRRGEAAAAIPMWRGIWTNNPTSPFSERAADKLAQAGVPVPSTSSPEGRELIQARIQTLEKRHLYEEALALRDLMGAPASPSGVRDRAHAAFRAKDYARAVELFSKVASPGVNDRYHHALGMSRTGDYAAAAALYRELMAAAPGHALSDTASYKLGYLAYDGGNLIDGIELFKAHLARWPASTHADEARWFIAWSLVRLDRSAEAETALDEFLRHHGNSELAAGAAYWQARLAHRRGDPAAAEAGYQTVLRRWPLSGYAWFAAERLDRRYPTRPDAPAPGPPSALDGGAYRRGLALARVGLDDWARAELAPLEATARASGRQGALALAGALIEAGDYPLARALAEPYCGAPTKGDGDQAALQLCWPRPVAPAVIPAAKSGGIPSLLPFAIMNAESALKPWVTSPAGARGLMQLMPNLAATLHTSARTTPFNPERMYQPGYNAWLGVAELTGLSQRMVGRGVDPHLPLVIASYNGGAEAVDRWLASYATPPEADWFAENISYTETRRYVRRVLGYLQTYRLIYGDG